MVTTSTMWCGLDVAKATFVAAIDNHQEDFRILPSRKFQRTQEGIAEMAQWIASKVPEALQDGNSLGFVMESTGKFSCEMLPWIIEAFPGSSPAILNPRITKAFIDSHGLGNRTDAMEARCLARMGTERKPKPTQVLPDEYQQLRELVRTREALVCSRAAAKTRLQTMTRGSVVYKAEERVIAVYTQEIDKLEKGMKKLVAQHEELKTNVGIMSSFPGIAFLSACIILSEIGPIREDKSRNELSAYTGLAPCRKESGTSVNKSRLSKHGSPLLRKVLYLCAIHSVKKVPTLTDKYERLVQRGKKPLTARCACMRSMVLILRRMVLNGAKYDPQYEMKIKTPAA